MPRLLLLCSTIVAAFQLHPAAAATPLTTPVPVTASVAGLAGRVGLDVARERWRLVPEIIRRVYSPPVVRQIATNLVVGARELPGATAPVTVEAPLSPEVWSQAIFKRSVPADQLLATILADRRAALLCNGLLGADDATLAFYGEHPALLAFLYERGGAFSAFAGSLRVRDGHLVVPGGDAAVPLWREVTHVSPDDPDAFVRALFLEPEARLAYLFDVLATASPEARAFALGLWLDDEALRARRFQALALAVHSSFREWHVEELPFARPLNDLALLLLRMRVGAHGEPLAPAEQRYWSQVFDTPVAMEPSGQSAPSSQHPRIDAAWLLAATDADLYSRGDKLDQLAFGQRVFGTRPEGASDAAAGVVREMPTRRMLFFGLERLGVTSPEVYVAGLRQARALAEGSPDRFWTLAQFQGALALVARMSMVDGLREQDAEALVRGLFALPLTEGDFRGGLATWLRGSLGAFLPEGPTWQARAIAGVSGGPTPGSPEVEWEGQRYRLDLAFAERRRIAAIREKQGGPDFDVALGLAGLAQRLLHASSAEAARPLVLEAQQLLAASGAMLVRPPALTMARGVVAPRDGREWLTRTVDDLDKAVRAGDMRRVVRAADSLVTLGDVTLGHALLSFVYAVHLGDPEGPALLGANVALRHDFGFGRRDGEGRARGPWAVPRQDFQPGVPWHVAGSLLGLDVGLAPLALHRISMDGLATPPQLQSIEREAFAVDVAILNPRRLRDIDRDRIVAAIARGRSRVRALPRNPADFEKLENEISLDSQRARSLHWLLQNEPASVENQLSLVELLTLGDPGVALDSWGANGMLSFGCLCSRFPGPRTWRILAGRTQLPMMAATTVEMNLELAERFAVLRLPAAILPAVLTTAMQDFVDQVAPADAGDMGALAQWVRALGRNAVDDYVSATATLDGPLVSRDAGDLSEP